MYVDHSISQSFKWFSSLCISSVTWLSKSICSKSTIHFGNYSILFRTFQRFERYANENRLFISDCLSMSTWTNEKHRWIHSFMFSFLSRTSKSSSSISNSSFIQTSPRIQWKTISRFHWITPRLHSSTSSLNIILSNRDLSIFSSFTPVSHSISWHRSAIEHGLHVNITFVLSNSYSSPSSNESTRKYLCLSGNVLIRIEIHPSIGINTRSRSRFNQW